MNESFERSWKFWEEEEAIGELFFVGFVKIKNCIYRTIA